MVDYDISKNFIQFEYGWNKGIDFEKEAEIFENVLNHAQKENDIQQYIKHNKKWFIPASIFEEYDFGHHEAYISPEQPLGNQYKVDYMLLGCNSLGYHIIFVEFEDVNVEYRIQTYNTESEAVRKGLAQIRDWKRWIDDNRIYFLNSCGLAEISGNIPSWGFNYCLVVSRRERIDKIANAMRSQSQHETLGLHIVTYDRLVDNIKRLCNGF